jgi:hypothetical protein
MPVDETEPTAAPSSTAEAGPSRRPTSVRQWLLSAGAFALYCLLTVAAFAPLLPTLTSALIGPAEDNQQDFWNLWYAAVPRHDLGFFQTNLLNFPTGVSLYYESFAYPKVFTAAALSHILGSELHNLILLHNLGLLISFPIAGLGAFLLLRVWTGSVLGALVGGYVFAFNPAHVVQTLHHMHVQSIEFIPYFVLSYILAIERRSVWVLGASLVFYALSALSCWYYLFYLAFFIIFHAVYTAWRARALPSGWHLTCASVTFGGIVLLLSPLLIPMIRESLAGRAGKPASGHDTYVADAATWLIPAPIVLSSRVPIISDIAQYVYARVTGNPWEATNYLGIANFALVAWLFVSRGWRGRPIVPYAVIAAGVFIVLASGARLHFVGHEFLILPEAVMSRLPFFNNVRTPGRAVVLVYLFISVMVAVAVDLLWTRLRLRRFGVVVLVLMVMAIIVDFAPSRLEATSVFCSPGFAILRNDPEPRFGVLNLPHGGREPGVNSEAYMVEATCHGRPIVEVMISRNASDLVVDHIRMDDLNMQRQQLITNHVKYIVLHRESPHLLEWQSSDGPLAQYEKTYHKVYSDSTIDILQVY